MGNSLLNSKAVKRFILDYSKRVGKGHTRIAQDALDHVETKVRDSCRFVVGNSPGKTVSLITKSRTVKQKETDM